MLELRAIRKTFDDNAGGHWVLADGLGLDLGLISETTDRQALVDTIEVEGMGTFDRGTQGAMRFAVSAETDGPRLVVEHVTRITPDAAPDWPRPGLALNH